MKFLQNFWVKTVADAGKGWVRDKSFRLSAALAFYSIFSLAPLLLISLGLAGLFLDPAAAEAGLEAELSRFFSEGAAKTMVEIAEQGQSSGDSVWATVLGVCALVFGATSVFSQMQDALDYIWGVEGKPEKSIVHLIYRRVVSLCAIIVIGLLLLLSLAISTFDHSVSKSMSPNIRVPEGTHEMINFGVSFIMITALFALIFKYLPEVHVRWRYARLGALVTAVLFLLGKYLLGWYLGMDGLVTAYGAAGALVLVLLWIYYSALILFFGAELTKAYAVNSGEAIVPTSRAVKLERVQSR